MDERLEAVRRMQTWIDGHLGEELTLARLGEVSHFSPWYAHRLFTQYTGLSPAAYVRRLRLSRSALRLRSGELRVTDAAFELGFGSVDGYQRAFYREFGMNPGEYAKSPVPLWLFTPYQANGGDAGKEVQMSEIRNVFLTVVEKPARKAVIRRGVNATEYFAYCQEVGCDIWGLLTSMDSLCGEPVCLWLPEAYRKPGTSEYVQGVEVAEEYDGPVPEGFDVISLPAAKYLMFQGEPFREEDYAQAIGEIMEAEKRYDPTAIGFVWDDTNPRIQLEPVGARGYRELLPIRVK